MLPKLPRYLGNPSGLSEQQGQLQNQPALSATSKGLSEQRVRLRLHIQTARPANR